MGFGARDLGFKVGFALKARIWALGQGSGP